MLVESPGVYRCVTHVKTGQGGWRFFSVDVAIRDFRALPEAREADLADLPGDHWGIHVPVEEG